MLLLAACSAPGDALQATSPASAARTSAPSRVVAPLSDAGQPVADLFRALQAGDEDVPLGSAGELLDSGAARALAARPSDWSVELSEVGPGGAAGGSTTVQVHFRRLAGPDFRDPPLCPFLVRVKDGRVTQRYSCAPY